jgi:hypothetical protein
MNIIHHKALFIKKTLNRVFLYAVMLILLPCTAYTAVLPRDSAATAAAKGTAVQDSINKAAADAAENEEMQRKEKMNTILEVAGSVVAIVGLVFLTWKFSSGSGKQSKSQKQPTSPHSGIRR